MELKNLIDFKEFDITKGIKSDKKISKEIVKESMNEKGLYLIYSEDDGLNELFRGEFNSEDKAREKAEKLYIELSNEIEHYDVVGPFNSDNDIDAWIVEYEDETIHAFEKKLNKTFESVTDNVIKGNEIKSAFDADVESKNLFGFAGVKQPTIKKIGSFTTFSKLIDPKTPKERPVLNAGQFIDNNVVSGYINRIEGGRVFVESLDKPGEIIEVSIKDAIKVKKEEKQHTATNKIDENLIEENANTNLELKSLAKKLIPPLKKGGFKVAYTTDDVVKELGKSDGKYIFLKIENDKLAMHMNTMIGESEAKKVLKFTKKSLGDNFEFQLTIATGKHPQKYYTIIIRKKD